MIELGLQRISSLLAKTPLRWRAIHVAGTNGKGSICAYVSRMLDVYNTSELRSRHQAEKIQHGRFTSPHLIDRWDCITLNQQPVEFSLFRDVEKRVLERNKRENIGASEFELLTATAFEVFNEGKVDVGVVEVGMGGRLDATNIVGMRREGESLGTDPASLPLVTTIANIGLDHQAFLGDTLDKIATEKAGIIKPGIPVVYDDSNDPQVIEVIRQVAATRSLKYGAKHLNSSQHEAAALDDLFTRIEVSQEHQEIIANMPSHARQNLKLALYSTCIALRRLERLPLDSVNATQESLGLATEMAQAAKTTSFPGRQQRINIEKLTGRKEEVLLDGAHNAQSAQALATTVEKLRKEADTDERVTWLIAASNSKDPREILSPSLRDGDAVYAVQFGPVDGMPWVKPHASSDLLAAARDVVSNSESVEVHNCANDVLSALKAASENAAGGPLVIAGSLYLVGDVLRLLRDN